MGGGGLLQLVAVGSQDCVLTGNPQITFFRTVFRRHTNFALETIRNNFVGEPNFGGRSSITISRTADLVSKSYIRVVVGGGTAMGDAKWAWVKNLGHALLRSVEFTIGGQRIDYHTSDWYHMWHELTKSPALERGYDKLIGNTTELTTLAASHDQATLYIPLQFFFCRHVGQAVPLIGLQYHEVKFEISFEELNNLIISTGFAPGTNVGESLGLKILDATLECGMIYLDTDERRRFSVNAHEILIEQVQIAAIETAAVSTASSKKTLLTINHPVKELVWGVHTGRMANTSGAYQYLWYHPTDLDAMRLIATKRFVLALAKYSGSGSGSGNDLVLANTATDTNSILPQVGLSGTLLTKFNNIKAAGVSTDATVDNVAILGDLLSLDDISTPVSVLFAGINNNRPANGHGSTLYDVVVKMPHNFGVYMDGTVNPLLLANLQLNGQDRVREQDAAYYNYLQPYEHHSHTPADGINVYSFAISPEEHQPSGTLNFSRIDIANLVTTLDSAYSAQIGTDSTLIVMGLSYNILRIMSGMAGLAYNS